MITNFIAREIKYSANTYKSLNVVINKAKGVHVWDINNKMYLDFLSGYSAVNQGHCHPKIVQTAKDQLDLVTITSRSFYNDKLGEWSEYVTNYFNYDKVLPMNSGAEAVESAIKLARRWGTQNKKGNKIITFKNNFHGRTIGVLSGSSNKDYKKGFGPFTKNFILSDFNDTENTRNILENTPDVCAILIEPIQAEGGVVIPKKNYLKDLYDLCKKKNILFIADEIQTGIGRTGKLNCVDYDCIKPDINILGKSLGGGIVPISCILANNHIMSVMNLGSHGSTFGGNPFACAVSMKSLEVVKKEHMIKNSEVMGEIFRNNIEKNVLIKEVRGKGLLNGIEFNEEELKKRKLDTYKICEKFMESGLLCKNTNNGNVIRFSPPLIINYEDMNTGLEIINKTIHNLSYS